MINKSTGSGKTSFTASSFYSLNLIETETISDLSSTIVGIILMVVVAASTTFFNVRGLKSDLDYLMFSAYNLLYPSTVATILFSMYYMKHAPMRKTLLREFKNRFGF